MKNTREVILKKFGSDLRNARMRRRITQAAMAGAVGVSLPTFRKAENGDPSVEFGTYVAILSQLGLVGRLQDLADASHDPVGLALEAERLPKRVGTSKNRSGSGGTKKGEKKQ